MAYVNDRFLAHNSLADHLGSDTSASDDELEAVQRQLLDEFVEIRHYTQAIHWQHSPSCPRPLPPPRTCPPPHEAGIPVPPPLPTSPYVARPLHVLSLNDADYGAQATLQLAPAVQPVYAPSMRAKQRAHMLKFKRISLHLPASDLTRLQQVYD